jgi:8-oxo-dGTP pyrophosphatase MutT (NUDIX family)
MTIPSRDNHSYRYPVSIKGVVVEGNNVVLLRNSRREWELPGGKLELHETPEACVVREIEEELSLDVRVGPVLDAWTYRIRPDAVVEAPSRSSIPASSPRPAHRSLTCSRRSACGL